MVVQIHLPAHRKQSVTAATFASQVKGGGKKGEMQMPSEDNAEEKLGGTGQAAQPLRIAIFDDSREALSLYEEHFKDASAELLTFTGSSLYPSVLHQLAQFRPQLIIADLLIGGSREDGYRLLDELHSAAEVHGVPVVVCSKFINRSPLGAREAERCKAAPGVKAVFPKFPALPPVEQFRELVRQ